MTNTISINDRLGPGGLENVGILSTDANGNTVLVDGDGNIIPTLGANTITVGAGGQYSTIQAAIDSVATADMFVPITLATGPVTVNTWAKGSRVAYTSSVSMGNIFTDADHERLWFKVAGDTHYYPLSAMSGWGVAGSTGDHITSKLCRHGASIAAPAALTFYREVPVNILLLDSDHDEHVEVTTPVCVRITSAGNTLWRDTQSGTSTVFKMFTSTLYGHVVIGRGVELTGGVLYESDVIPASILLDFEHSKHYAQTSDLHSVGAMGGVRFFGCDMFASPIGGLGHFCLTGRGMPGDVEVYDSTYTIRCNRSASARGAAMPFDSLQSVNFIASNLTVLIDSEDDDVGYFALVGLVAVANENTGKRSVIQLSDISVLSLFPSTANVMLVDENSNGTNDDQTASTEKLSLAKCSIHTANISGTAKLFNTSTGGSGRVVSVQACSGGVVDTPSVGSRTVIAMVV